MRNQSEAEKLINKFENWIIVNELWLPLMMCGFGLLICGLIMLGQQ